jgi:hypothetical protein
MANKVILRTPTDNSAIEGGNPLPISTKNMVQRMLLAGAGAGVGNQRIPLPDYKNPSSRLKYAQSFLSKYGSLMQGRGDTPLRVNERPAYSNATSKEMSQRVGAQYGIDPALLYSGTMEEGMSGIYPGQPYLQEKFGPNKEYPIDALWSFGLDSFLNKQKDLMASGKLPKEFSSRFTSIIDPMKGTPRAYFKTPEDAMTASAAMWKGHYEDIDNYTKQKGIKLSPKARDFFARVGFNAGEGTARQMVSDYNVNNLLAGDVFMKKRPISGKGLKAESYKDTYENVQKVMQMTDALKKEGLFDSDEQKQAIAEIFRNPSKSKVLLNIKNKK